VPAATVRRSIAATACAAASGSLAAADSEWSAVDEPLVGAAAMHNALKRWIAAQT